MRCSACQVLLVLCDGIPQKKSGDSRYKQCQFCLSTGTVFMTVRNWISGWSWSVVSSLTVNSTKPRLTFLIGKQQRLSPHFIRSGWNCSTSINVHPLSAPNYSFSTLFQLRPRNGNTSLDRTVGRGKVGNGNSTCVAVLYSSWQRIYYFLHLSLKTLFNS